MVVATIVYLFKIKCKQLLTLLAYPECPSPSVRMTVTPQNVHGMAEGVAYYVTQGFDSIHPVPNMEAEWTAETLELYAENMEKISALFIHHLLNERNLNIYGITDVIRRAVIPPRTYLCGAGRAMAALDTDGALFPCQRFIGYSTSNPKWKQGKLGASRNGVEKRH